MNILLPNPHFKLRVFQQRTVPIIFYKITMQSNNNHDNKAEIQFFGSTVVFYLHFLFIF